jgi:DNA-binding NarL/FixJ family response regulator
MDYVGTGISIDEARAATLLLGTNGLGRDVDAHRGQAGVGAKVDGFIAVIESRAFMRECIRCSMQAAFSLPVITRSAVSELEIRICDAPAELVILSLTDGSKEGCAIALKVLSELVPGVPIIVLTSGNDMDLARTAIHHGAKGYIPYTMGFQIAVEAVRFVLAGGTYVPTDCLLAEGQRDFPRSPLCRPSVDFTDRELAVIRGIQQGKSNKVIAHELNVAESTVKVHVRNVMRKMSAKNRTEVAVKTQTGLVLSEGEAA